MTLNLLECDVNTSHECTCLRICSIVNTRRHRVILAACIHFWVVAVISGDAEQVVAREVYAYILKPDGLNPFLRQSITYGDILETQETCILDCIVTEVHLRYRCRIVNVRSCIDFVQTCHNGFGPTVCGNR